MHLDSHPSIPAIITDALHAINWWKAWYHWMLQAQRIVKPDPSSTHFSELIWLSLKKKKNEFHKKIVLTILDNNSIIIIQWLYKLSKMLQELSFGESNPL